MLFIKKLPFYEKDSIFIRNIKTFVNLELSFKSLKNKPVMIYDGRYSRYLSDMFEEKDREFFYIRKENFNFLIILKTLFKNGFKNFMQNYRKNYFDAVNPKFFITMNDKFKEFYNIKKFKESMKTIVIQSGTYYPSDLNILEEVVEKNNGVIDYYFTFGDQYSHLFKKLFKNTFFFKSGSLRNNNYIKEHPIKKKTILYISVFKPGKGKKISENEEITLKLLENFCQKNNMSLTISTRFRNKKDLKHYNFLNNKHDYEIKDKDDSVYKSINSHEIMVSPDQTVAYEALALKKKVLIVNPVEKVTEFFRKKFNTSSRIWIKQINKEKFYSSLNLLLSSSKDDWEKILLEDFNDYIIYDPNSKKLIAQLNKIGLPISKKYQKFL